MLTENFVYNPQGFVDCENDSGDITPGDWRHIECDSNGMSSLNRIGSNHYCIESGQTRDAFESYFTSSSGSLPWQNSHVTSCGSHNY